MKTLLLLVLVVVGAHSAVVKAPTARANLNVGYVLPGDQLLHRSYYYRPAVANTIQYQDIAYRGNYSTRISAVQASEVGGTQYGSAWVISGGLSWTNVTVRLQSARGYGYYYVVSIWGR